MFSSEERQIALDLFFEPKAKPKLERFVKELGYPSSSLMLRWVRDDPRHATDNRPKQAKYDKEFILDLYFSIEPRLSAAQFVEELGYPARACLAAWLRKDPRSDRDISMYKSATFERKLEAVKLYESGMSGASVVRALELGSKTSVYLWHKAYKEKGVLGLLPEIRISEMIKDEDKRTDQAEPKAKSTPSKPTSAPLTPLPQEGDELPDDPTALKEMINTLRLKLAISEEVLDVLKADPRSKAGKLTNREKTIVASRLEERYCLMGILVALGLRRSTYYYNLNALTRADKYAPLRARIVCIFEKSNCTWGSERIWAVLKGGLDKRETKKVSEKVVRRLMAEEGCVVIYNKKPRRRYSSYEGEVSKAPKDSVKRDFHAGRPNELWLTDITEFKLPSAPKVYLSAIIDCFDGKPIAWKIGLHPTKDIANIALIDACAQKAKAEHPVIHSDRGAHYRWPDWIEICRENSLTRSMSALGSSPDNAAMEGFFGSLKNDFFYYRDWEDVDASEFIDRLDKHLCYHCDGRIKKSLGWKSPNQYRRSLNLVA